MTTHQDAPGSPARALPPEPTDAERLSILRRALVAALRAGRHVALVDAEAPTSHRPHTQIALIVGIIAFFWMVGASIGAELALAPVTWLPISGVSLIVFGLAASVRRLRVVLGACVVAAIPVTLAAAVGEPYVWATHVVPAALVVVVALVTRSVDARSAQDFGVAVAAIVRSAPLLGPLVLVVLVLPALSADLWQAASKLDVFDIAVLFAVTVAPLSVLVMRQLFSELPTVLAARANVLVKDPRRDEKIRSMLQERINRDTYEFVDAAAGSKMREVWPDEVRDYVGLIAAAEGDVLRRPLQGRLAICIVAVSAALAVYLYIVLATVVDPSIARGWSKESVPIAEVNLFGLNLFFPGGIYVRVVALLGALATATFLAFALLEERFSNALGDALLKLPADRLLSLALPYLVLREQRINAAADHLDEWDPGAIQAEEASK